MKLSDRQLIDLFEESLNDISPEVDIIGYVYPASLVLKRVDPVSYDQAFMAWLDESVQDECLFVQGNYYYDEKPEHEEVES